MDPEEMKEQSIEKVPNLEVAYLIHHLQSVDDDPLAEKLKKMLEDNDMTPMYDRLCHTFSWCTPDNPRLSHMQLANMTTLFYLEGALFRAGDKAEKIDWMLKKAEYYSKIGDKISALRTFEEAFKLSIPLGTLMDALFHVVRIGMFYLDYKLMHYKLHILKGLMYHEVNWERRNRMKIYEGVYCISIRQFHTACYLFLDTISTFSSYEIMNYARFIRYTVYLSVMVLPRRSIKKKIIENHRVRETLSSDPETESFLFSLYNCNYAEFFITLAKIEHRLKTDHYFHMHYQYYIREMKIIAYTQLLESYRSLSISNVAENFGVSEEYIEKDISLFICSGRLCCQINRLTNTIETNRPDKKNRQFQLIIKQGDLLLNRIQKLSRVIEI
ncbi:26S proteasome non-ATPase regulatory subunit 6-like isoform X2 [Coccinella septempunctata]|nr:26S proteasome non-ATPase regulatory subunit 6-like isoform X2 [Coccinella septempunctata]